MKIKIVFALPLLVLVAGCAVTDIDRTADFSRYRKYSWSEAKVDVTNPLYKSDLINAKIRTALKSEFGKKGIVEDTLHPDFLISYHIVTEKKEQQVSRPYRFGYPFWGYGGFYFPYYGYWGMPYYATQDRKTYTEGTLIIDIIDAKTNKGIWRGSVAGNVDNVRRVKKQIEKGVRAIMNKYPSPDLDEEPIKLPEKEIS